MESPLDEIKTAPCLLELTKKIKIRGGVGTECPICRKILKPDNLRSNTQKERYICQNCGILYVYVL